MNWFKRMKKKGEKLQAKAKAAYPRLTKKALKKMPRRELTRIVAMIAEELDRRGPK